MSSDWIFERYRELERNRRSRKKNEELMQEYDRTVYYPQLRQIRRSCFQEGHRGGKYHDNGFGWSWFYCAKCGGRYDIVGPDDQRIKDDGDE
jgi:hypothetical protein